MEALFCDTRLVGCGFAFLLHGSRTRELEVLRIPIGVHFAAPRTRLQPASKNNYRSQQEQSREYAETQ